MFVGEEHVDGHVDGQAGKSERIIGPSWTADGLKRMEHDLLPAGSTHHCVVGLRAAFDKTNLENLGHQSATPLYMHLEGLELEVRFVVYDTSNPTLESYICTQHHFQMWWYVAR